MFSNTPPGDGSQRISAEEARELIRGHQNREAAELPGSVTVQDMAEVLNLPVWQVEQMVNQLRNRPPVSGAPISSRDWLKTQLWKWVLVAVAVISIGPGIQSGVKALTTLGSRGRVGTNRTQSDGIYDHASVALGREIGMTSTPGFSYKIKYGTVEAAANGDSKHYIEVSDDMSKENLNLIQEQYTNAILDGFSKAVAKYPPEWVNGEAPATVKPNYYPGGFADPIDVILEKNGFPYAPDSDSGKAMHDKLLQAIKDHWDDITHN